MIICFALYDFTLTICAFGIIHTGSIETIRTAAAAIRGCIFNTGILFEMIFCFALYDFTLAIRAFGIIHTGSIETIRTAGTAIFFGLRYTAIVV
jgi:hypothetical protein